MLSLRNKSDIIGKPYAYDSRIDKPIEVNHKKGKSVSDSQLEKLSKGIRDFGKHLNQVLNNTGYGISKVQDFSYQSTEGTWWVQKNYKKEVKGDIHLATFSLYEIEHNENSGAILITLGVNTGIHVDFFTWAEKINKLQDTTKSFDFEKLKKEIYIP